MQEESAPVRKDNHVWRKADLTLRFALPVAIITATVGYAIGFRRGHSSGASIVAKEFSRGKKISRLERERVERYARLNFAPDTLPMGALRPAFTQ